MKQVILSLMAIFVISDISSQLYSHSPNDSLMVSTTLDESVTMNITQLHPGNDTLYFHWQQLEVTMPDGWEASICDNSNCYTSLMESGSTLPVLPGDNGLLLIHCTPHINTGTGIIRYTIYEEHSPNIIDTLTWIVIVSELGIEPVDKNEIDYIFSQIGNSILISSEEGKNGICKVRNLLGELVCVFDINQSRDLSFLTPGYYLIEVDELPTLKRKIWIQ